MIGRGMIATCFAFALLVVPAAGDVRFAEPNGNGPSGAGGCLESDPCGLEPAIEDAAVVNGDEIRLLPGTYDIAGATLSAADAITIHARDPGTRPTITGTDENVLTVSGAATVEDLAIKGTTPTGGGATLFVVNAAAVIDRVAVESTLTGGTFEFACGFHAGLIRDSTCRMIEASASGFGVALGADPSTVGTNLSRFINVTADGSGQFTGLLGRSNNTNIVTQVIAKNVIAPNVIASTEGDPGSTATVTLTNSNFPSSNPIGTGTSVTAPGSPTNQTAPPVFADEAGGDYHQLAGSPTINAGATDALLGTQDIDFTARIQGSAPDIGADEFVPPFTPPVDPPADPPDTKAPTVTITSKPKSKVKTKKKTARFSVGFSADETSTFRCSLDGQAPATCSSPFTGKVKKGKHTVSVTATDAAGNASAEAEASWTVKRKRRS